MYFDVDQSLIDLVFDLYYNDDTNIHSFFNIIFLKFKSRMIAEVVNKYK